MLELAVSLETEVDPPGPPCSPPLGFPFRTWGDGKVLLAEGQQVRSAPGGTLCLRISSERTRGGGRTVGMGSARGETQLQRQLFSRPRWWRRRRETGRRGSSALNELPLRPHLRAERAHVCACVSVWGGGWRARVTRRWFRCAGGGAAGGGGGGTAGPPSPRSGR